MDNKSYSLNFGIALEAILANKVRSILTALGIIFGVSAVIAMLAIGNGARQEILDQIKLVGVNNIIIKPRAEQKEGEAEGTSQNQNGAKEQKKFSPGLNLKDVDALMKILPCVSKVCPEIIVETSFIKSGYSKTGKLVGIGNDYFEISNFSISEGSNFNTNQARNGDQVCIIGAGIKAKFFSRENPIGKFIKCGTLWLKVVGVMQERHISQSSISNLGIRDYNMDIYTPLQTILIRFKNRSLITKSMIMKSMNNQNEEGGNSEDAKEDNAHQLDRLILQVKNSEDLMPASEVISRAFKRRHYDMVDYEITIPEMLLKQQQRTKDIFNIVLGAIAGISLLVGGIGIMNIMLASVLERIKEIGIRMSLGAKKKDIVEQFLFEAILISVVGGLIGIILGIVLTRVVAKVADISTIISWWSVGLSFGVSVLVGLVFGIAPARRAAEQDPITCLRYE